MQRMNGRWGVLVDRHPKTSTVVLEWRGQVILLRRIRPERLNKTQQRPEIQNKSVPTSTATYCRLPFHSENAAANWFHTGYSTRCYWAACLLRWPPKLFQAFKLCLAVLSCPCFGLSDAASLHSTAGTSSTTAAKGKDEPWRAIPNSNCFKPLMQGARRCPQQCSPL